MRILKLVRLSAGSAAQSSRGIILNTHGVILARRKNRQTRGTEIYDLRSCLSAVLQLPPSGNEAEECTHSRAAARRFRNTVQDRPLP